MSRRVSNRDTILTINVVESPLVEAVKMHSKVMRRQLKGLVLVDKNYAAYKKRPKDSTGLFKELVCDFDNLDELQTALKPYTDRLLAATCRYEEALQPFGKVIPFLPYIYTPSPASLVWSTEKPLMRDRLSNYDKSLVPKYRYLEADDLSKLKKLVDGFSFPVIVKPSGLSKALLVTACRDFAELKERLDYTFKIIRNAYEREHYPGKPAVLVEEMMQGEMYSTDAYVSHNGEISCLPLVRVFTAHSQGLEGFYGYEQFLPSELSKAESDKGFEAAKAAIRALNLSSTTAHIEMYRTAEGWKIIEVAARIGGFRNALYREVYGIEHYYNDLAVRMGDKPKLPAKAKARAAALKVYPEKEGKIKSIKGLEQARRLESVVYLLDNIKIGEPALFVVNGGDPVIEGILSNKDPKKLKNDLAEVRKLVKIETATR